MIVVQFPDPEAPYHEVFAWHERHGRVDDPDELCTCGHKRLTHRLRKGERRGSCKAAECYIGAVECRDFAPAPRP